MRIHRRNSEEIFMTKLFFSVIRKLKTKSFAADSWLSTVSVISQKYGCVPGPTELQRKIYPNREISKTR